MFVTLRTLGNRLAARRRKTAVPGRRLRPALEHLEDRVVLSLTPIQAKYLALGGAQGILGQALTAELPTPYGSGRYEQFENGAIIWSAKTGAHDIYGPIASEFFATANETNASGTVVEQILGLPTRDEGSLAGVSGALTAVFQGGTIDWSAGTGAHAVYGEIAAKYKALGGPAGYGLPTSDETDIVARVRVQYFQHGAYYPGLIEWSAATGAHTVYGAIGAEYAATANENSTTYTTTTIYFYPPFGGPPIQGVAEVPVSVQAVLGAPTSDEMDVPGVAGARMNSFQGGNIYWSPSTGAHVIYGDIAAKFSALGGPTGYGLPTSDQADVPGVSGVQVSYFQNGGPYTAAIFWSAATGAHAVYGAIGADYAALANETDYYGIDVQTILGAPTSDEMDVPGVAGARMNTFQGGEIYFSPSSGAHVVYGGINGLYNSMSGPTSYLGLPTSDEEAAAIGRVSYFQNGKIVWTPSGGAYAVQAVSMMTFDTGDFNFGNGFFDPPASGSAELTVYADGGYHFTGHLHDSGFLPYRDNLVFGLLGTSGYLYTFVHSGYMAGTLGGGSRDDMWDVSGSDPRLAANWADLEGCSWYWKSNVNADLGPLVNQIEQVAGVVLGVVGIIVA